LPKQYIFIPKRETDVSMILWTRLFVWVKFIQQVMGRIAYHFFFSTRVSRTSCNF